MGIKLFEKSGLVREFYTDKYYINIIKGTNDNLYDINVFPMPISNKDDVIETQLGITKKEVFKVLRKYGISKNVNKLWNYKKDVSIKLSNSKLKKVI